MQGDNPEDEDWCTTSTINNPKIINVVIEVHDGTQLIKLKYYRYSF